MHPFLPFLQSQHLLTIAMCAGTEQWIANLYFGTDENGTMYFISPTDTAHSKMILENPQVVFSTAWFDPANHKNRKAIQGRGTCRLAQNEEEMATGVRLHTANFPEFKERITTEWIRTNEWGAKVWVLQSTYIKYWDDERYGDDETEEFHL